MSSLFTVKASPVERIPAPVLAKSSQLAPKYIAAALRAGKNYGPWAAAGGVLAVWFTYPAWRESFKDRVIPGYAAVMGHEVPVDTKK